MLQAAEQSLGLAIVPELLAADALANGRLVRLSPLSIVSEQSQTYHLVFPPALREWPPLVSLRLWLRDEFEMSRKLLHPETAKREAKKKRVVEPTRR